MINLNIIEMKKKKQLKLSTLYQTKGVLKFKTTTKLTTRIPESNLTQIALKINLIRHNEKSIVYFQAREEENK